MSRRTRARERAKEKKKVKELLSRIKSHEKKKMEAIKYCDLETRAVVSIFEPSVLLKKFD